MNPYPLRIKVIGILTQHRNKWLKTRTIAKEVGINTPGGISRVSNVLYRLRHLPNIERKSNSHAFQYRYYEEIKGHHTNILPSSKTQKTKKAKGERGKLFKFVECVEPKEGFCDQCESYEIVTYQAEREDTVLFLCEKCGRKADRQTGSYAGVFQ